MEESGQAGEWVVSGLVGGDRKLESSRRSSPKRAKEGRENGTATRIRQILRKASKCLLSQIATLGQTAVWWRMEVRVASKIPKR